MMDLLKQINARLGEPSTWASIGLMLGMLHLNIDTGTWSQISLWGAVLSGALGVFLKEQGSDAPVASDVIAALVDGIKKMPSSEAKP